ncbi:MAG: DUF935 family protein [Acidobacteria bacterium]|nr:DUF935 family protein [Acidobacteriota bacterium]
MWLLRDPEVEEKMLRDADIRHAVGYRRHLIAGRNWSLKPKLPTVEGQSEADAKAAKFRADLSVSIGTELLGSIKHFTRARLNLSRAFFSGARFAIIGGKTQTLRIGDGKPRTWWVPTTITDQDKRMYRIVPEHDDASTHIVTGAHWDRWSIGRQQFEPQTKADALQTIRHVYEDDQASLGHGSALREALGWWWYAKTHVFQESLTAVERFAQGIVHAKIDGARDAGTGLPNQQLIAEWQSTLEDLMSRHVLVSDKHDDIEIIKGNAEGYQLLSEMRQELKNTIYTLVMGANLTTAADGGGSYALAEVQENSTQALIQYDRETLQETLTEDLLGCVWAKNWPNLMELGIAHECPEFSVTQEKIQDPKERAEVAEILGRMGVELSRDDVLEQTGFRIPEEGEETIEAIAQPGVGQFGGSFFDDPAPAPGVPTEPQEVATV